MLLPRGPAVVPIQLQDPPKIKNSLLAKELLINDDVLLCTRDSRTTTATRKPFDLVPGDQNYAAEFHYEPENANDTVAQVIIFVNF